MLALGHAKLKISAQLNAQIKKFKFKTHLKLDRTVKSQTHVFSGNKVSYLESAGFQLEIIF